MNAPLSPLSRLLRPEALGAPQSGIVEAVNYGRTRPGLIPLWVGEGDMPTPAFICEAATRSLAAGETFYTWQRGIPELREALAAYIGRLYRRPTAAERFFVTASGMQAVQVAVRLVAGAGDEVLVPTPAWPNFAAALGISGAMPVAVPMSFGNSGWVLDLERFAAAVTPRTKALVINSPANPTGWTATREELSAVLAMAREKDLWIIADEIYGRFVHTGEERAPSFHDIMEPDDRILFVQTFSKNWCMTGWRLGWLEAPAALGDTIENLIQYSTSGAPVFVQRAGIAALELGESFVAHQISRARQGREIVCSALSKTGSVQFHPPAGAFYLFFKVAGEADSRLGALRFIDDANVGLAPGTAFGPGLESYYRLCFARKAGDLEEAGVRLAAALSRQ